MSQHLSKTPLWPGENQKLKLLRILRLLEGLQFTTYVAVLYSHIYRYNERKCYDYETNKRIKGRECKGYGINHLTQVTVMHRLLS